MKMDLRDLTVRWALGWLKLAVMVFFSTLLLCTPFVPLVWLLWNWIAPIFGLPRLTFVQTAGFIFLLRFLQASVALIGNPPEKQEQAK